jgi:hypothetical protein
VRAVSRRPNVSTCRSATAGFPVQTSPWAVHRPRAMNSPFFLRVLGDPHCIGTRRAVTTACACMARRGARQPRASARSVRQQVAFTCEVGGSPTGPHPDGWGHSAKPDRHHARSPDPARTLSDAGSQSRARRRLSKVGERVAQGTEVGTDNCRFPRHLRPRPENPASPEASTEWRGPTGTTSSGARTTSPRSLCQRSTSGDDAGRAGPGASSEGPGLSPI